MNLLRRSAFALLLAAPAAVIAFIPESPLQTNIQGSIDAIVKKASESSTLKSSRAELMTTKETAEALKMAAAAKPLLKSSSYSTTTPLLRTAKVHKRWGIDNTNDAEYWMDSRIHTLGNCGFWGAVHAALAPISTKLIDDIAYEGVDIRKMVAEELSLSYRKNKARVLDLCCGVGFSTRALRDAFPDAETVVGVDTSSEMLAMARFINAHLAHLKPWWDLRSLRMAENMNVIVTQSQKLRTDAQKFTTTTFTKSNAEKTPYDEKSFDVVTVMYAFHEAPRQGRERILREARRVLNPGGILAVIDISSEYKPSESMLSGEPYVLEYQKNIHQQLRNQKGFTFSKYKNLVPGHVGMWVLKRSPV